MTSQNEKTEERVALEAEAKSLGVKGAHMGSDENLAKRVAEARKEAGEDVPRSVAPRMSVSNIHRDDRTAKIQELEAKDPDCKYMYQSSSVTDDQLRSLGLERTPHSLRNDIICRTQKEGFVEYQDAKNEASYDMMKSLEGEQTSYQVPNLTSQAKAPKG